MSLIMLKSVKSAVAVPVRIDDKLYEQIKAYSEVTGVPVVRVVHEAVEDFVSTTLQARLEALQTKKSNVVSIDVSQPQAFAAAHGRA